MARVTGPLMSMDASGTIAGAIVFSRWKGLPYVRRHAIPSNPKSPKQTSVRAAMRFLTREWPLLTAPEVLAWEVLAETMHQSAFNRFCGMNAARWRSFLAPVADPTAAIAGTAPALPFVTPTGGVRMAQLQITAGANPPDLGWWIHRSPTAVFTPTFANLVGAIDLIAGDTFFVDTPLAPADYYYQVRGAARNGIWGAFSVEVTAAVT